MRYLDADALRKALPMHTAIDAMVAAFSDDREIPQRILLGRSLFMPGRAGPYTGIKVVSTTPGDPAGIVGVFDPDGHLIGLVDGATLTAIRTGAASGLATRILAPEDSSTLAMLGAGAMAADQIEAVRTVRPIERVLIWSRRRERAEALARRVGGIPVATPDEAVAEADVVTTATPSTTPLFRDRSLRNPVHINAVGAFTPDMAEVPPETVTRAYVVVDDLDAAAVEAGDLIQAHRTPDATVSDLLAGVARPKSTVTLFKSVGIASQDVAAAVAALEAAS